MDENRRDREALLLEHILEIKDDIAEIKVDLRYHVKRTDIAEENLKMLREELKPVDKHVEQMRGALNLLKVLGIVLGVVLSVAAVVALL